MTANEILSKHLIKHVTSAQKEMILAAMEEYAKVIHKNTRHRAIELINELNSTSVQDFAIMNMPYEDIKPK